MHRRTFNQTLSKDDIKKGEFAVGFFGQREAKKPVNQNCTVPSEAQGIKKGAFEPIEKMFAPYQDEQMM